MEEDKSPNLENFKRRAFELCLAVYRVTKLFPAGEILINQLRETASQIVVLLATGQIRDTILKAEELKIYLGVAREQNWLKPINFDLLKSAYSLLSDALAQYEKESLEVVAKTSQKQITTTPLPQSKKEPEEGVIIDEMGQRQRLIISYLQKNKEAKVSELLQILGGVSERTIRNDLADLISRNLVKKVGSTKDAKYILI